MNRLKGFLLSKNTLFFIISLTSLQLGMFANFWNVADQNWFDEFEKRSESLVLGRLAASEREGMGFKSGFLGRYHDKDKNFVLNQYAYYEDASIPLEKGVFNTYNSQIGCQGLVFYFIDSISPFSNTVNIEIFKFLSSFLFSLILALFLLWVHRRYGLLAAIITLILFLLSHWLTVFGRNLYWVTGVLYVPFIAILFILNRESLKTIATIPLKKVGLIAFILVLFKCLFTGFEMITTSLIMFVMPFVYYAVLDKWKWKTFFSRITSTVIGSISAMFLYFFVLIYQISLIKGSLGEGLQHIVDSFLKRTSGTSTDFPEAYQQSLESTISLVLGRYWNGTAIDLNTFINTDWESLIRFDYGELILIFVIFSLLSLISIKIFPSIKKNAKANTALIIVTWLSITATLSWFVIFKGHSYIHIHTNFIAWYMPFCLFGFAIIGSISASFFIDIFNFFKTANQKIRIVGTLMIAILIVGILLGQRESIAQYQILKDVQSEENRYGKTESFDVYLYKSKLWYIKENANKTEMKTRFFVHIFPNENEDLPEKRKSHGFDNLDFNYPDESFQLPWWYGNSNFLVAVRELPDYEVIKIRTGQYAKKKIIWEISFQPD